MPDWQRAAPARACGRDRVQEIRIVASPVDFAREGRSPFARKFFVGESESIAGAQHLDSHERACADSAWRARRSGRSRSIGATDVGWSGSRKLARVEVAGI